MNARVLLYSLLLFSPVYADSAALPLRDVMARAEAILDVTITGAQSATYQHENKAVACGFILEARVGESFKGGLSGTIVFASDLPLVPQDRVLLFLRSNDGGTSPEGSSGESGLQRARTACIGSLPRLKSDSASMGVFIQARSISPAQFVKLSNEVSVPPELAAMKIEVLEALLSGKPANETTWPQSAPLPPNLFKRGSLIDWALLRPWLTQAPGKQ